MFCPSLFILKKESMIKNLRNFKNSSREMILDLLLKYLRKWVRVSGLLNQVKILIEDAESMCARNCNLLRILSITQW